MDIHADHPDFEPLAREGRIVAYFGYGSLVNRATLRTKFLAIRRAEVTGWRRFWLPRPTVGPGTGPGSDIALLSVRPDRDHVTQGVVVYDHADHLALVDEREAGYVRREIPPGTVSIEAAPPAGAPVHIYEAIRREDTAAGTGAAILQSYLDAVLQGFHALYGRDGLERFVAETEGFETVVILDRKAPRYPRAVALAEGEAALFDRLVEARGARFEAST